MKPLMKSVAFAAALALVAAACAEEDADTTEDETAEESEETSEETSEDEDAMDDEDHSDDAMDDEAMEDESAYPATVVDIAASDDNFSSLVAAVTAADLGETLSDPEAEFTVFAPTNDAFDALAADLGVTLEEVLEREDLADILKYHVVSGVVDAEAAIAAAGTSVETLQGGSLDVVLDGETLTVGGANVTATDLKADNGVVHVIDAVLVPAS